MTQLPSRLFGHSIAAKHYMAPTLDDNTFTTFILVLETSKLIRTARSGFAPFSVKSFPDTPYPCERGLPWDVSYQFITQNDNNNIITRVYIVP